MVKNSLSDQHGTIDGSVRAQSEIANTYQGQPKPSQGEGHHPVCVPHLGTRAWELAGAVLICTQ